MNIPKEIILTTLYQLYTSSTIHLNQIKTTNYDNFILVTWIDEYCYKQKFKIIYDKDFKNPNSVISNRQFSYNNKLYQLLVIEQPLF